MKSNLATRPNRHVQSDAVDAWSRERHAWTHGCGALGPAALLLAGICAVIVFFPPEGRVSGPLHDLLGLLFGRLTFILPLALVVVGVIVVMHGLRPGIALPRRRLTGLAVMTMAVAASENLIANGQEGTGLVGTWLSASLINLLGGPLTIILLVVLLGWGIMLAFELRRPKATAPATPDAES